MTTALQQTVTAGILSSHAISWSRHTPNSPITISVAMTFVHQAGAAVLLIVLTLWLQYAGLAVLIVWVRRAVAGDIHKLGAFSSAWLVVHATAGVIALHGLQVLLWAACFRWLCFPSWEVAFYFSATSYATVGYGDVVLPSKWRLLGPLESMLGVIMCGVSVSILFALVTRLVGRVNDSSARQTETLGQIGPQPRIAPLHHERRVTDSAQQKRPRGRVR